MGGDAALDNDQWMCPEKESASTQCFPRRIKFVRGGHQPDVLASSPGGVLYVAVSSTCTTEPAPAPLATLAMIGGGGNTSLHTTPM